MHGRGRERRCHAFVALNVTPVPVFLLRLHRTFAQEVCASPAARTHVLEALTVAAAASEALPFSVICFGRCGS